MTTTMSEPDVKRLAEEVAATSTLQEGVADSIASNSALTESIASSSELQEQVAQRYASALEGDRLPFRIAVVVLGLTIIGVLIGAIWIKLDDPATAIPDVMVAMGTAAIAALAGLLSPIGAGGRGSQR
jgi:hypothetical protein